MASLKGTKTEKNLLIAFAGESQARNRYTLFAEQARKENFEKIAQIFIETAENEFEHAKRIFKFLEGGEVEIDASYPAGKIGTTAENLEAAAAGEHYENTTMYPEFAQIAEEEGFKAVATVLRLIGKVEVEHEKRYLDLLEKVKNESYFKREKPIKWKCLKCGYVHEGPEPPGACPVCQQPKAFFEPVE
jgi:rubrerythrin